MNDMTFTNCNVTDNFLELGYGGGIYIFSTNNLNIENLIVTDNSADFGGGVCLETVENIVITDIILQNNIGYQTGGGIYGLNVKNLDLIKCEFISNEA